MKPSGLSQVSSQDLTRLLRSLHRGHLPSPVTRSGLIAAAFGHLEAHLDAVVGRDLASAKVLIAAVLAERDGKQAKSVELSFSGVPAPGTRSRDVLEQVRALIGGATQSIELVGIGWDDDPRLLRTVAAVLQGRDVTCRLVLDGFGREHVERQARELVAAHFRPGKTPEVWVSVGARLRAHVAIVDERRALVTSGGLTSSEADRAVHVGVLLDDARYVSSLHEEWERLLAVGAWVRVEAAPVPRD